MTNNAIIPGRYYRHFKGQIYKVIGVALFTETDEPLVIYQAQYDDFKLFARPLEMFTEKLDASCYPNATQKFRFELIDEKDNDLPQF